MGRNTDMVTAQIVDAAYKIHKAVETLHPVHRRQAFTYLRLLDLEVAFLLNFGATLMKDGIVRIVNGYRPTPQSRMRLNT